MELTLDEHVKAVLEFMQERIPVSKLLGVSERLPGMAKLLWDRYPQESVMVLTLSCEPLSVSTSCEKPLVATV